MSTKIELFLRRGPATSGEIQAATGLSQGSVSRAIRALGDRIIRLKVGRSPFYFLTRDAFGSGDRLPLYMVDPHGNNTAIGLFRPLAHGGFFLEKLPGMPAVLLGDNGNGLFPDLPYFLYDLAPQGFIGRQIASMMAKQSSFPSNPQHWSIEHIGLYLVANGEDLPGNLKLGEHAHLRLRRKPASHTPEDYPELAESVLDGSIPGSSAGGEQPKFTAYRGERSTHVIVKFSPKGDDATARRWRDILVTEFHATEAIHAMHYPAAETRLIERGGRLFLESLRFDRSGEYGRLSMISLLYVDAEFTGTGKGWHKAMHALHERKLVSWQHLYDAAVLWCFGKLIHNTDMHLGNLSLGIDGGIFRLRPVYDMCSMGFAPKSGEVPPMEFECSEPDSLEMFPAHVAGEIRAESVKMAREFWNRVAGDKNISPEFREYLSAGNPVDRYHLRETPELDLL